MPTDKINKHPHVILSLGIALLGVSVFLMWLPALHTPFWGDDYVFLRAAHATNISSAAWWSDFWPRTPPKFWRPLSQEAYWRVIDALLHGNAFATHLVSLGLHLLASVGVAVLAFATGRACGWSNVRLTAVLAGVLYAGLAMHILPVHWAAAANNSLLTIFTTLALAAWVQAAGMDGLRRTLWLASVPLLLTLALLSKESAVLTTGLMLIMRGFTGQRQAGRGERVTLLVCAAITVAWLLLRTRFTAHTDDAYGLSLGLNVVRNAAAFAAWLSNIPREAVRMGATGEWSLALAWIAATSLPMIAAAVVAFRPVARACSLASGCASSCSRASPMDRISCCPGTAMPTTPPSPPSFPPSPWHTPVPTTHGC